jgi:hypothetical protein
MIEDTAKIVNEAQKDKVLVYLIINNRAGGNAPLVAQKITERVHSQKQQRLFLLLLWPCDTSCFGLLLIHDQFRHPFSPIFGWILNLRTRFKEQGLGRTFVDTHPAA